MKRTANENLRYFVFRLNRVFKNRSDSEEDLEDDVKSLCRMFSEQFIKPLIGDVPLCPIEFVHEQGKMPANTLARYNPQTRKCEVNLCNILANMSNRDGIAYVDAVYDYFLALSHSMVKYLQYEYASSTIDGEEARLASLESALAGIGGVPVQKLTTSLALENDETRKRRLSKQLLQNPEYEQELSFSGEKVNFMTLLDRLNSDLPSERSATSGAQTIFGNFIDVISQYIKPTNIAENALLERARMIQASEKTKNAKAIEKCKSVLSKMDLNAEKQG